ncbi:MAG TPA: hypothetical protein DCS13_03715 [Candidatus Margulisbacteria bacterium]|nr:MAG: hypothetical protein A2X43_03805 [Candidatus Margulisbacteria bacterium GWD2_39_127]OGI02462.1 MAG: hypothetical protein A2X42_07240 [Candidatus Margulisbacteria bacterium GWF2_38_17]OGI10955.1 MAG: hypothetical protein A2X41_01765 [Candidatus Margulisbacteria bacterium GWE2_39_32]HAR62550.1 hypothetical protein [Candidatus Margulisiibacteriota bacterium]
MKIFITILFTIFATLCYADSLYSRNATTNFDIQRTYYKKNNTSHIGTIITMGFNSVFGIGLGFGNTIYNEHTSSKATLESTLIGVEYYVQKKSDKIPVIISISAQYENGSLSGSNVSMDGFGFGVTIGLNLFDNQLINLIPFVGLTYTSVTMTEDNSFYDYHLEESYTETDVPITYGLSLSANLNQKQCIYIRPVYTKTKNNDFVEYLIGYHMDI